VIEAEVVAHLAPDDHELDQAGQAGGLPESPILLQPAPAAPARLPRRGESSSLLALRKAASTRRATVCLFSFHPLLLSEFQRLLTGENEARVLDRRVEANQVPEPSLSVPRASVYVVEAHSHRQVTEAFVTAILARYPKGRLIVIAEKLNEVSVFPLLRQGVKGLLKYSEVAAYLPRTLREVADGGFWVPRALLSAFVDSTLEEAHRPRAAPAGVRMSKREQEVLELLMQNLPNKEIGSKLHMSERTAKFHVSNLLAKYDVQRRADLILLFVQAERDRA
jgi:two-component system response regulator DevR